MKEECPFVEPDENLSEGESSEDGLEEHLEGLIRKVVKEEIKGLLGVLSDSLLSLQTTLLSNLSTSYDSIQRLVKASQSAILPSMTSGIQTSLRSGSAPTVYNTGRNSIDTSQYLAQGLKFKPLETVVPRREGK